MYKVFVLIALMFASTQLKAQQNNTLFLMHELPQANIVNPAVPIKCKLFIGMPILGSTHVNAYSSGFAFSDIFENYNGDSLRFNPDKIIHKFNNLEILATEIHLSLLSIGYKIQDNYFTFAVNEKFNTYHTISKNALILANEGNSQFVGKNVNMDGSRVNAIHYREFALGWAKEVNEKLDIGIRAKLLFGKANLYSQPTKLRLYTDPTTYALNLIGSANIYSSYPLILPTNEQGKVTDIDTEDVNIKKYLLNAKNKGLGIDLGIIYKLNHLTTISASLLDIGFIKWNSDANQFQSNGQIDITSETYNDGIDNFEAIKDTLFSTYELSLLKKSYSSPLVPAFYAGIEREITQSFEIGAVFHNEFFKKKWHPSVSLTANKNFGSILSTGLSYTLQNKQLNNIGIGVGLKLGPVHLHALTDNIPAFFSLENTRNLNLRFGISFLSGCSENQNNKVNRSHGAIPCTVGNPYKSPQRKRR